MERPHGGWQQIQQLQVESTPKRTRRPQPFQLMLRLPAVEEAEEACSRWKCTDSTT